MTSGEPASSPDPSGTSAEHFAAGTVLVSRFSIVGLLGSGGMGDVYEAFDQELRETVALKTIRLAHAGDERMVDRLRREVLLARRVTHRNVCRVFDVFRATPLDRTALAVVSMELVRGGTLSDRVKERGRLPWREAAEICVQLTAGLHAAHGAGVIHRDFKSSNVLLTTDEDGLRAVITDFGLATSVEKPDSAMTDDLTVSGAILGTPAYMSPEQVMGEKATIRSDIYALGIVLYEMVSGALPFRASTPLAAALKRLAEPPEDIRRYVPGLPPLFSDVISRCLEVTPEDRFGTAIEVADALERATNARTQRFKGYLAVAAVIAILWAAGAYIATLRQASPADQQAANTLATARRSVALFGFKNLSGQTDSNYLSTALDEGLGSELSLGLRIVAAEEVSRLKQELNLSSSEALARDTLDRIRRNLGVDLVVSGSYIALGSKGGGQVRVFVRVQDTRTGETAAMVSNTGVESDLLTLISDSGADVRNELGIADQSTADALAVLPSSESARRLYVEGLDALRAYDAKKARDLFERSISKQSDFALAHLNLARAWAVLGNDQQATREAATALELAQNARSEDQTWIRGMYAEYTRNWPQAIAAYRELVRLHPDDADYALRLAAAFTAGGQARDALDTLDRATQQMPTFAEDARLHMSRAAAAEVLGDAVQQETAAAKGVEVAERQGAWVLVAHCLIARAKAQQQLGRSEEALNLVERSRQLFQTVGDRRGVARALILLGELARHEGRLDVAERHLRTALNTSRDIGTARQTMQAMHELGGVMFDRGDFAAAADMLEDALTVSRELADRNAEARTLGNLASVRFEQGRVSDALRLDESALAIQRKLGDQQAVAFSLSNIAETAADLGKLAEAERYYEESRDIATKLAAQVDLSYALSGLSAVKLRQDDLGAAKRYIEEALRLRTIAKDKDGALAAQIELANVTFELGESQTAENLIQAIWSQARASTADTASRAAIVHALVALGRNDASAARDALTDTLKRSPDTLSQSTRLRLLLVEGLLLSAQNRAEDAIRRVRKAREEARIRGLVAYELESDFTLWRMRALDVVATKALLERARANGFRLIVRRVSEQR